MAPADPLCPCLAPAVTRGRPIPGRPSDGITRRRLLALASGAIAAGILAACGEEAPAELAGVALPDISRPAPRAPRDVGLPEPGEGRPIQIAMTSYGSSFGGGVGLDVVAVLSTASRISRDRFDFGWSEVRSVPPYVEWDMSAAIADLIPPLPDVILFHTGEFADLVAGGSLDPLEPHLAIDPGFEPGAYWPGRAGGRASRRAAVRAAGCRRSQNRHCEPGAGRESGGEAAAGGPAGL